MRSECTRTADVLAAMTAVPFPGVSNLDLDAHVGVCQSCRDLVAVVSALRGEREHFRRDRALPSAGLVWWRAKLRQRQEAARKASAPVTVSHAAALVGALVLAASLTSTLGWAPGFDLTWATDVLPSVPSWAQASQAVLAAPAEVLLGLVLAGGVWLILAPVALYLAVKGE